MAIVQSVNVGARRPSPYTAARDTGIDKRPQTARVEVRDPGRKGSGLGSGLVGDYIGDGRHHGGSDQAVYAFAREDLDFWERELARPLPDGHFGENLTTVGLEVSEAVVGERWRVGAEVELVVTLPRLPCGTFRGWIGERGWLRRFTQVARSGAYLRVAVPGFIEGGDAVDVLHVPDHGVTVAMLFRALTLEPELLPELAPAGHDLPQDIRELLRAPHAHPE